MSYTFAGFFASPPIQRPPQLPAGAIWREITDPFAGVGLRLPALVGKQVSEAQVLELAQSLGLSVANQWLFLQYDCWAGQVDFAYGLGAVEGRVFGPVEESARDKVQSVYTNLMGAFGVSQEPTLDFPPFHRGFWGET